MIIGFSMLLCMHNAAAGQCFTISDIGEEHAVVMLANSSS